MQRRIEVAARRKEMRDKICRDITMMSRHKIETYVSKRATNTIAITKSMLQHESSYKQQSGRSLKTHVATQKLNVTPPIPVRPDWRIQTGFGVRNHMLGLLIIFFFFRADLICGIQIIFVITNNHLHLKMNYRQSGIH